MKFANISDNMHQRRKTIQTKFIKEVNDKPLEKKRKCGRESNYLIPIIRGCELKTIYESGGLI